MNNFLIIALAVVGFCYFGGNNCPKVLKDNKEMLLGVLVGLALCSFMGVRLEGFKNSDECKRVCRNYGVNDRACERYYSFPGPPNSRDPCAGVRYAAHSDAARGRG